MSQINFDCVFCGQNMDAPEEMAGQEIECPQCGKLIRVAQAEETSSAIPASDAHIDSPEPSMEDQKSATVRIDLPKGVRQAPHSSRVVTIKRSGAGTSNRDGFSSKGKKQGGFFKKLFGG